MQRATFVSSKPSAPNVHMYHKNFASSAAIFFSSTKFPARNSFWGDLLQLRDPSLLWSSATTPAPGSTIVVAFSLYVGYLGPFLDLICPICILGAQPCTSWLYRSYNWIPKKNNFKFHNQIWIKIYLIFIIILYK